jgi:two-component system, NarL family, invasion response regulator UvrY
MIRIFIADDHPVVRAGLRHIVEQDPEMIVTGEAASRSDLVDALSRTIADVVLLDVSMPGMTFADTLQLLRADHPSVKILVLSVHPEDQFAVRALRSGASGYVTKDHSATQLLDAVRHVFRGGRYVSTTLAERLASFVDPRFDGMPHERLSDREFEVLRSLGTGLSVKEAADELHLSPKTVSTYRTRLLEKMGLSSTADIVRYAAAHGLIPAPETAVSFA